MEGVMMNIFVISFPVVQKFLETLTASRKLSG